MKIYAMIPARGGSKGVPKKNIQLLAGFPLIAYSIAAAKLSQRIERVIVSTDCDEIAGVARDYGAEVPFMRPADISGDTSTDLEWFEHAIQWLNEKERAIPDLVVHLRPTTPLREPAVIDQAIEYLENHSEASSLRSASEMADPPQKMFQIDENNYFRGLFPNDTRKEYYNLPRQMFPKTYNPNGFVDIVRPKFVMETGSYFGPDILAFLTPFTGEVDRMDDMDYLEYRLKRYVSPVYDYLVKNFTHRQGKQDA